jgi:hypothetical protein
MNYQQLQKDLFEDPTIVLYALPEIKDAILSAIEKGRIYRKNQSEDIAQQVISIAEHVTKNYDLNNLIPEQYRPFARLLLSRPFCEVVDFAARVAKQYGEGKTTEQALRTAAIDIAKMKIGKIFK